MNNVDFYSIIKLRLLFRSKVNMASDNEDFVQQCSIKKKTCEARNFLHTLYMNSKVLRYIVVIVFNGNLRLSFNCRQ